MVALRSFECQVRGGDGEAWERDKASSGVRREAVRTTGLPRRLAGPARRRSRAGRPIGRERRAGWDRGPDQLEDQRLDGEERLMAAWRQPPGGVVVEFHMDYEPAGWKST